MTGQNESAFLRSYCLAFWTLVALTSGAAHTFASAFRPPLLCHRHGRAEQSIAGSEHEPRHPWILQSTLGDSASSRRLFLSFAATAAVTTLLPAPDARAAAIPLATLPLAGEKHNIKGSPTTQQESISGFVAGALLTATKTVVKYPLDTATVRLQMPETTYSIANLANLLEGSFRGIASPLLWNIPAGAVFFAVKDATKQSLSLPASWANTMVAVGIAQFPYWLVRNPSEVVKTKQQAGMEGYDNVSSWEAFGLVKEQSSRKNNNSTGLEGYYVGYWENIVYAYPADVIKFVLYEQITGSRKNLPPLESAAAGAIATALSQFATTPLDVVRNRVMAGTQKDTTADDKNDEASYIDTLITLAKEEGLRGLFAGASPRVGKAILSGAIQFATYEETKQQFAKYFQTR